HEIARSGPPRMQFYYLAWDVGSPLAIQRDDLVSGINQALLIFTGLVLGVAGTLAAILVTASIIPQTFEAGAIDLLLSKPVSRPLVFLTKFVGGCVFIAVIAAWLIGGIWLILGVRFDLWNPRLLLCIPLYLFLFAIYYAVSALAGVIWKNAIVSVVLTVLFWFVCWSVGTTKNVLETIFVNPQRIVKIVPAGDALLAGQRSGESPALASSQPRVGRNLEARNWRRTERRLRTLRRARGACVRRTRRANPGHRQAAATVRADEPGGPAADREGSPGLAAHRRAGRSCRHGSLARRFAGDAAGCYSPRRVPAQGKR
ncbi:MAG TPA: ABC transporter permease, partial [Pirellulales bacterium]